MENNYLSKINDIYSSTECNKENIQYYNKVLMSSQFNLMSASIFKILPLLDFKEHYQIFNGVQMHNRLTQFEQISSESLSNVTIENMTEDMKYTLRNKPCIITSFHFGSYRMLNKYLLDNNISYTAVGPKSILDKEKECFEKHLFKKGDAKFIELEAPNVAFQILRELRNGRSVFVYVDGFRGNIQNIASECAITKLLQQKIYVRKGIFQLASIANVPIISSVCYRKSKTDLRIHFFEEIRYDGNEERDIFVQNSIDKLYSEFSKFLVKYPEQWEGWMYVYKQLIFSDKNNVQEDGKSKIPNFEKLHFNFERYGIFKVLEEYFLFDRHTMLSYCIDENLYDIINQSIVNDEFNIAKKISNQDIQELYSKEVLVA